MRKGWVETTMFSQLFGKYLVEKNIISSADYQAAIERQLDVRVKLGTIAVAEGLLTEAQVEALNKLQMQFDKRFGDLAVEKGYLTQEQVQMLLKKQGNPYMQFLQVLLEQGKVNVSQMDAQLSAFQKEKGFSDADMTALKNEDFDALVSIFAFSSRPFVTELAGLVVRNLNRFVTRDFYIGQIRHVEQMKYRYLAGQRVAGDYILYMAFAEEEDNGGFTTLTSAFAGEKFEQVNGDVYDAVCEFINCSNGLFASDVSSKGINLDMEPTFAYENQKLSGKVYALPIYIEDHKLQLLIAVDSKVELGQKPYELDTEIREGSQNTENAKGTVLVVDDSKMSRKMLRTILEEEGYAVIAEAGNGEEGVEAYKKYHPTVVTLDITMPRLDGIGALKEIMAYDSSARVVMITAAGQQQKIIEALKLGAQKFITKPFEQSEVLATVHSLMK